MKENMKGIVIALFAFSLGMFCFYVYQKNKVYDEVLSDEESLRIASISFMTLNEHDIEKMYGNKNLKKNYLRRNGENSVSAAKDGKFLQKL